MKKMTSASTKVVNDVTDLAQQAFIAQSDMEQEIFQQSDLDFLISDEWDLYDEEVRELKKTNLSLVQGDTTPYYRQGKTVWPTAKSFEVSKEKWCILHPESGKKLFWDSIAMVAILFDIFLGPLNVYNLDDTSAQVIEVLHWTASLYWLCDIPVSFCTAVYVNDVLHYKHSVIAKTYVFSWFSFDLLMLLPDAVQLLALGLLGDGSSGPGGTGMLRIVRMKRLVRLFRFLRVIRLDRLMPLRKRLELLLPVPSEHFRVLFPILQSMLALILAVHWLASGWFVLGSAADGWVCNQDLDQDPFAVQYMRSVEWSLARLPASSLRTNMELQTRAERWLAILATFVALVSSSLFVGVLTNVLADLTQRRKKMNQILESVRKYCADSNLPFTFAMEFRRRVEREHFRQLMHGHVEFLQTLPDAMVCELFHAARSRTLARSHPFFHQIGKDHPHMESDVCMKAVSELYLLENDTIFDLHRRGRGMYLMVAGKFSYVSTFHGRKGDASKSMSILSSAWTGHQSVHPEQSASSLELHSEIGPQAVRLRYNEHISEHSLWIKAWKHRGRLDTSSEQSRALLLSKDELHGVLREYSDVLATVVVYARIFVGNVNSIPAAAVSDLSFRD